MHKTIQVSLIALVLTLSACSPKLRPLNTRQVSVEPEPLMVVGQNIESNITLHIPEKWFHKKASLKVMPVMRINSSEVWGGTYTLQGEQVYGNNTVVPYNSGGNFTFSSQFAYNPRMQNGKLYLTLKEVYNGKERALPELLLTQGVIATATLAQLSGATPYIASNKFQRIITEKYDADIHFLIEQANVRSSELEKTDLKDWKKRVEEAQKNNNQNVSIEVQAYASPDGGVKLNEKLSKNRELNTTSLLKKNIEGSETITFGAHYTAQDWEGFRRYVQASNLPDKELILRVLEMYNDPEEREREIRNISVVYDKLATDILPKLRRSRIIATIETIGKSDNELSKLLLTNPKALNIEEYLYATELQPYSERMQLYSNALTLFPKDPRAYNNLAAIYLSNNETDKAEPLLNTAISLGTIPEANLNLALIKLEKGNLIDAETLIGNNIKDDLSQEVYGLLLLKQGKFTQAAEAYKHTISNNAAIALILTNNYAQAIDVLDKITKPNAITDYLRAIVAARQGDARNASNFLNEALQKDFRLRDYASNDIEFRNVRNNPNFIVN